jgi:ArsR family transcriptional regulator, arsenate/arsenite/antimonite-responsive transcriptional repressor
VPGRSSAPARSRRSSISHHLKILREAGIVDAEKRGPWVYYRLARGAFAGLGEICARLAC